MERLAETLNWLYSLEARGEIYKLERMENALALIGNPHLRLRAVHIAGTKGKGSVSAMLDSCLRAAGLRVGLYTKPHLVNLSERTRVDGAEISSRRMLDYIEKLRAIYEDAGLALTFFEFTVALMFQYFADENVDVAVIETGLGGRLDSTNVVHPFLSVITPIGFDHMEYLGYTIPSIAAEKGGIIKPDIPVVIGARDPEAREVLTSMAAQRHSPSRLMDRDFSFQSHAPEHRIDYQGLALNMKDVELSLAGPFQHENAAIAIAALEAMRALGWNIDEEAIRRGLKSVYWPGRFDIVSRLPLVVLDCAHNELEHPGLARYRRGRARTRGEAAAHLRMPGDQDLGADGGDAGAAGARRDPDDGEAEAAVGAGESRAGIFATMGFRIGSSAIRCAQSRW